MQTAIIIVLAILLLAAIAGVILLLIERTKMIAQVARASGDQEQALAMLTEREQRAVAAEQQLATLRTEHARLETDLATLRERLSEREARFERDLSAAETRHREQIARDKEALNELNQRYQAAFAELAGKALKDSTTQFLQLAEQSFAKHKQEAGTAFDNKHKQFAELVTPIAESLKKADQRLTELDKARLQTEERLSERVQGFMHLAGTLSDATRQLTQSLKAPQVRGRWGEMQLRRVVELAGMSAHCDFDTQATIKNEDGNLRPDMLIHLPGQRHIVVDAKAPLHAYLEAIEATTDEERAARLKHHAKQVRDRVNELASKGYQKQFETTPDFTVLFVPGDQFLSAALMEQPDLLEHAAANHVILTTPATLIALLKAVQFGWAQASLEDDAREILRLGRDLYDRMGVLAGHFEDIGKHLSRSVTAYNKAVGSYESRLLPSAARMGEHNIRAAKDLPEVKPVTTLPREVTQRQDDEPRE